jgi:hypothetical protein
MLNPTYSTHFLNFFLNFFTQMTSRLNHSWLNVSHFFPSSSLSYQQKNSNIFPQVFQVISSYLTESIPTLFSLLTKSIPLFSFKFSTLFNKKHRTYFSQIFKVINKRYFTFLKCFSCYLIESNPFFFIVNNKYPTIFLQVFHII